MGYFCFRGDMPVGSVSVGPVGDSSANLHQLQNPRLDQIRQIVPRRDYLIEVGIL